MEWIEHKDCSTEEYVHGSDPEGSLGADHLTPMRINLSAVCGSAVHFNQCYTRHRAENRNAQCSENITARYLLEMLTDTRHWI